jgi:hypothetical protein
VKTCVTYGGIMGRNSLNRTGNQWDARLSLLVTAFIKEKAW